MTTSGKISALFLASVPHESPTDEHKTSLNASEYTCPKHPVYEIKLLRSCLGNSNFVAYSFMTSSPPLQKKKTQRNLPDALFSRYLSITLVAEPLNTCNITTSHSSRVHTFWLRKRDAWWNVCWHYRETEKSCDYGDEKVLLALEVLSDTRQP